MIQIEGFTSLIRISGFPGFRFVLPRLRVLLLPHLIHDPNNQPGYVRLDSLTDRFVLELGAVHAVDDVALRVGLWTVNEL